VTVRSLPRLASLVAAVLLAALIAAAGALFLAREPAPLQLMRAGAFDPPHAAPEFSLSGSDGSEVTLGRYRGKVVLLTFGFTHCAAVCPTTLATLAQTRNSLGKAADSVQVIFVTVDPDRDSAAHMQQYLAAFDPTFIGATGSPGALAEVREDYGVTATREGTGRDYAMAHTSSIFLIDRAGKLRALMPFGHEAADFVHDIELLLKA
jgi:protein SCO1/2